jgi:hypothetical protein
VFFADDKAAAVSFFALPFNALPLRRGILAQVLFYKLRHYQAASKIDATIYRIAMDEVGIAGPERYCSLSSFCVMTSECDVHCGFSSSVTYRIMAPTKSVVSAVILLGRMFTRNTIFSIL